MLSALSGFQSGLPRRHTVQNKLPAWSMAMDLCWSLFGHFLTLLSLFRHFVSHFFARLLLPTPFRKGGFGGCSPGTKTGTRVHSDVPPERKPEQVYIRMFPQNEKPERGYVRQDHPFTKPLLFVYQLTLAFARRFPAFGAFTLYEFASVIFMQFFFFLPPLSLSNLGPPDKCGRPFQGVQEPNPNRKPEPLEPFSQEPNAEPEPPKPFSRNRPLCETVLPRGTAGTENRDRSLEPFHPQTVTEPNRTGATGWHPAFC